MKKVLKFVSFVVFMFFVIVFGAAIYTVVEKEYNEEWCYNHCFNMPLIYVAMAGDIPECKGSCREYGFNLGK